MTTRRRLLTTRVGLGLSLDLACAAGLPPDYKGDDVVGGGGGHDRDVELEHEGDGGDVVGGG